MASVAQDNALTTSIKSWPERVKTFYNDVRTEMKKVTAPSFKEIQSTTIVVIITVFIFGLFFGVSDWVLSESLERFYKYFTH